jgi:pimeloyl-ACP methyl ester carboxylesterase
MARARDPRVAATVLLASSPLRPALSVVLRIFLRHPLALLRSQVLGDMEAGRPAFASYFFSPDLEPSRRARYLRELSGESARAVREVFQREMPPAPDLAARPVLVVAGRDDWSIPMRDHEHLARSFRAPLEVCPGAHDLMLDTAWRASAEAIHGWLLRVLQAGRGPEPRPAARGDGPLPGR